jgi:hypothetical protein
MAARLPDFLGIGTQKGGTTSLQKLLELHRGAYLPAAKELHYFSLHGDRGAAWYAEQFSAAGSEQRCGEITPYYLFHPEAPGRIQALLPQARLMVLLRDPVERALSQYFHARRLGFEALELAEALAAEPARLQGSTARLSKPGSADHSHQKHSYVSRSRYEQQLERYAALFPTEQLLVLRSEDLFGHTEACWQEIQAFLGLDPLPLPAPLQRANAGRGEADAVPESLRTALRHELAPTAAAMRQRYGIDWGWG